eukprot:TRINITY_DN1733_c0_g1_i10.p1 TRINITY_DN1733_c0_g1~~TRINITY_DN1733_c0_g1_i10.p1  ORF type:complete len:857 (+),score=200.57 TRINITY_DN1733_c0_g1_i10:92-2662(+)
MLGIKSLTLVLAVSMIFATGLILGGISISTGNASTDEAREAGDRGISDCMESGGASVRGVTAQLLHSVLMNAVSSVTEVVAVPGQIADDLASFVGLHHPDVSASSNFIDTDLRTKMYGSFLSSFLDGKPHSFMAAMLDISPNSETLRQQQGGVWGGTISYDPLGIGQDGKVIAVVGESRPSDASPFNDTTFYQIGNADAVGRIIGGPCNFADMTNAGRCYLDASQVESSEVKKMKQRVLFNMYHDDPSYFLSEPGSIIYSPIHSVGYNVFFMVCKAFVHPEQVNIYPRQNKRTGLVMVTVDTNSITRLLKSTKLPESSILYGAEKNPWTGEVITLAGCNIGEPLRLVAQYDENGAELWNMLVPFTLLTHTVDGTEEGALSPISRFSEHMIRMANGSTRGEYYETVSNLPTGAILDWTDTNTSVLYWVRIAPLRYADLQWYMIFLVPRSSVMSVIDESAEAIRVGINQDKKDTDDKRQKKHVIMYVVTAVCVVILLIVSLVFTNVIISPLTALSDDMAAVAVMETDAVDLKLPLSSLSEVRVMQKSFRTMVKNLIEYKNYMPQSVLLKDSDTEEDGSEKGLSNSASTAAASKESKKTMSQVCHQQQVQEMGLKKKTITVLQLNSVGWHSIKDIDTMQKKHSAYITALTTTVGLNKGVCDSFNGDRLMACFNAHRNNGDHRAAAIRSGLAAKTESPLPLSFAVTSGEAKVGNMGIVGMKKFSILSPIVPFSSALERYSLHAGYSCLIDKTAAEHTKMAIESCAAVMVLFKKVSANAQLVYEAISQREVKEEEWMYQLESKATFQSFNEFVNEVCKGSFGAASASLKELKVPDGVRTLGYWKEACEAEKVTPIELEGVY